MSRWQFCEISTVFYCFTCVFDIFSFVVIVNHARFPLTSLQFHSKFPKGPLHEKASLRNHYYGFTGEVLAKSFGMAASIGIGSQLQGPKQSPVVTSDQKPLMFQKSCINLMVVVFFVCNLRIVEAWWFSCFRGCSSLDGWGCGCKSAWLKHKSRWPAFVLMLVLHIAFGIWLQSAQQTWTNTHTRIYIYI